MNNKKWENNRILVVDDDLINIEIIKEILGDNFNYVTAMSGKEALAIAAKFVPDVILLDIMMPEIDGYEVCRQLRADPKLSLTKIILVSAKQMLEDRLEGYRAGADDYLTKPFEPTELLAKIKVFLRLKSVEEIEKTKSDLISVFSHETKTPLHAILGFAKLLLDNPDLEQYEREALLHIKQSGEDMLRLVDKTILLSHLKDGSNVLSKSKILISRVICMAISQISSESDYYGTIVENLAGNRNYVVNVDERLMVSAIACLLSNSLKYSEKGNAVEIDAKIDENKFNIIVKVTGKLICEDSLPNLFSAFTVENVSLHGKGSGLDLSIVKNVTELHDGTIFINTDRELGTNLFVISLPIDTVVTD